MGRILRADDAGVLLAWMLSPDCAGESLRWMLDADG